MKRQDLITIYQGHPTKFWKDSPYVRLNPDRCDELLEMTSIINRDISNDVLKELFLMHFSKHEKLRTESLANGCTDQEAVTRALDFFDREIRDMIASQWIPKASKRRTTIRKFI